MGERGILITVTINGRPRELDSQMDLVDFLEANEVKQRMIAIGYNGEVVHRERWHEVVLREGDNVDIVQMVGGG